MNLETVLVSEDNNWDGTREPQQGTYRGDRGPSSNRWVVSGMLKISWCPHGTDYPLPTCADIGQVLFRRYGVSDGRV